MAILAHLVFRNPDGSFTAAGWYWLALSALVFAASLFLFAAARVVCRVARLQDVQQAPFVLRLLSVAAAGMALWFGLMAVTAGPGQLV